MPLQTLLFPVLEPLQLGSGTYEELHLHLLEFAHTEDELAGDNLVAESFADLCDAERYLHAAALLHIEKVDEDALGSLWAEVEGVRIINYATHFCGEHQIELTHICPVAGTADRADNLQVENELLESVEVVAVHAVGVTLMNFVNLFLVLQHTGVGGDKLLAVEGVTEAFMGFLAFFVYLLFYLGYIVFDKDIGTVTFLAVLVVDERVVECVDMTAGFPDARMHEYGTVQTNDVLMHLNHGFPPILFDIVFQRVRYD